MKAFALFAPLITVAMFSAAPAAHALDWQPSSAIKVVVPYPPGGGTDVVARLMSVTVGDAFGQPMVIENRAGANGVIGANAVYGTKADGQTLLFGVSDIISTTPHVNVRQTSSWAYRRKRCYDDNLSYRNSHVIRLNWRV
jgi:tripartite-type tricarboxylate transporter receptor subunit TctC